MGIYKIIIQKQILILTALAIALNLVRVLWSNSTDFVYLIWNIFLAFLPFNVSATLLWYKHREKFRSEFLGFGLIVWLFLFPNAPYLVTDIIHLGAIHSVVPLWYDALLLFSSALVGMLLGIYSLSHIEQLLSKQYSKRVVSFLLAVAILVCSFGIYIGRFLRWNTWDIVIAPRYILNDISVIFFHPLLHIEAYTFTVSFFVFIYISYISWKLMRNELIS